MSRLALHASAKTAAVVGATGLVGGYLLRALAEQPAYARVIALSRSRPTDLDELPGVDWEPLPSAQVDADGKHFVEVPAGQDFYSALGTTRAKAGGAEAFERIDYGLNVALARGAVAAGYGQYLLVSSVGSDPRSQFLYSRVKGTLELDIKALPFWGTHIFQPGLLLGERNESRWGERLAKPLFKGLDALTAGRLGRYRPVEAEAVAQAMVAAAQRTDGGIFTYTNPELQVLAEAYYRDRHSLP